MRELRERLERAVGRLEELRDSQPLRASGERLRLGGKIEGVKLAMSYLPREDDTPSEIAVPRLVGNPLYAHGLVTPEVTHNGLVVVDFRECRYVSDSFLMTLLDEIKASGAAGILVRRASEEVVERIALFAAGVQIQAVTAG